MPVINYCNSAVPLKADDLGFGFLSGQKSFEEIFFYLGKSSKNSKKIRKI